MMYDIYLVLNRRFFAALVVYMSYTEFASLTCIQGDGAVQLVLGLSYSVCHKDTHSRKAQWPVMH